MLNAIRKFCQTGFNAGKVVAGQNRSLWSVSRDEGQFSISDGLTEREKRGSERERERAGLPCVKLLVIMCSSDPDVDRIPDTFSNAWSSAHQNRLEDNIRKCLSKTFVWKFAEWDSNFSFVSVSNTVYIRLQVWIIISKVASLRH